MGRDKPGHDGEGHEFHLLFHPSGSAEGPCVLLVRKASLTIVHSRRPDGASPSSGPIGAFAKNARLSTGYGATFPREVGRKRSYFRGVEHRFRGVAVQRFLASPGRHWALVTVRNRSDHEGGSSFSPTDHSRRRVAIARAEFIGLGRLRSPSRCRPSTMSSAIGSERSSVTILVFVFPGRAQRGEHTFGGFRTM